MELRTIYFTEKEIEDRVHCLDMLKDFPMPDRNFISANLPTFTICRLKYAGDEVDDGYECHEENGEHEGYDMDVFISVIRSETSELKEEVWLNAILEAGVSLMEEELKTEAKDREMILSSQFAPGRGDMEISLNHRIAALTRADMIGIRVDDSGIMRPQFTRSGIYYLWEKGSEGKISPFFDGSCGAGCQGCMGGEGGCGLCIRNFTN